MGLFLALSGVVGGNARDVQSALMRYATERKGQFRGSAAGEFPDIGLICEGPGGVTVLYPGDFLDWDGASQKLSVDLGRPVFSLHVHDGDLWMYVLYNQGQVIDQFNPIPDYWGELPEQEMQSWRGDAAALARLVPGLNSETVSRYLVRWDLESDSRLKSYPDDRFGQEDWQLLDFMRKLGLRYPVDESGRATGERFALSIPE